MRWSGGEWNIRLADDMCEKTNCARKGKGSLIWRQSDCVANLVLRSPNRVSCFLPHHPEVSRMGGWDGFVRNGQLILAVVSCASGSTITIPALSFEANA